MCSGPSWILARLRSHWLPSLERAIWVASVRAVQGFHPSAEPDLCCKQSRALSVEVSCQSRSTWKRRRVDQLHNQWGTLSSTQWPASFSWLGLPAKHFFVEARYRHLADDVVLGRLVATIDNFS